MSLSKTLQSPEILAQTMGKDFATTKTILSEIGRAWYQDHPEETVLIKKNLDAFGLVSDKEALAAVQEGIMDHYAEKIFPLSGEPEQLAEFIASSIDTEEASTLLKEAVTQGSVLLATPHFGGVEFVTPTVSSLGIPTHAVLRFSTQSLSDQIQGFAKNMTASDLFAPIKFIEIGKPGVMSALSMNAVLRRKEALFTVFDEETDYSVPVKLFGKTVEGGAGLDRLLRTVSTPVTVFNVFMIRQEESQRYLMKLLPLDPSKGNLIQQMYDNLESVLRTYYTQWYFLHEEIPFVDN